jgi:DNA-binding MarR family transcriptional regulator
VTQVLVVAVQNAVRYEDLGVATSSATMFRLIGGSVGTAVLGALFAAHVGGQPQEAYVASVTAGVATVFRVAAFVGAAGFVLTWFIPALPLRETVAAASASVGKDAGEAFGMPGAGDPGSALLRGLAILADRDAQREHVRSITNRAGLDLTPVAAWLLLRMGEDSGASPEAIAREHQIEPARRDEGLRELEARGYIIGKPSTSAAALTPEGCVAYDRLADARRERLRELAAEWPEAQRQHVTIVLQRLARDLVPSRAL